MNIKDLKQYEIESEPEQTKSKPLNLSDIGNDYTVEEDTSFIPESLKAGAAGAAESATFGFAPEIGAGIQSLFGDKSYKEYEAENEAAFRKLEQDNPASYLTGELAGAVGQGLVTGGLGTAAKVAQGVGKAAPLVGRLALTGAATGAASGLGYSKDSAIDALSGDTEAQKELAKDIAIGIGVGAAGNVVMPYVAKGAGEVLKAGGKAVGKTVDFASKKLETLGDLTKSYKLAKQGISVAGEDAKKAIHTEAREVADQIAKGVLGQESGGSDLMTEVLKKVPPTQDISAVLKEAEDIIQKNPGMLQEGKDRASAIINNFKTRTTTETIESGRDIAKRELEKKQIKKMAEAEALGQQDVSFTPVEDFGEFLQTVKTQKSGEEILDRTLINQQGTGLEKANDLMKQKLAKEQLKASTGNKNIQISDVIFDEESGNLVANLTTKNKDGSQSIRPIFQKVPKDDVISNPIFGDKNTAEVLQENILPDRITSTTVDELKDMNLQNLYDYRKALADSYDNADYGTQQFIKQQKKIVDQMVKSKSSPEDFAKYLEGKSQFSDSKKFGEMYTTGKNAPLESRAIDIKGTITKDENTKSMEKLQEALKFIREENVPQNLRDKALTFSERIDLNRKASGQSITKDPTGLILGSVGAASVRTGELLGSSARMAGRLSETPKEFTKKMLDMSESGLVNMASRLPKVFSDSVTNALKDSTKKDRLIWAISQQPAFREAVNRLTDSEKTVNLEPLDVNIDN